MAVQVIAATRDRICVEPWCGEKTRLGVKRDGLPDWFLCLEAHHLTNRLQMYRNTGEEITYTDAARALLDSLGQAIV